MGTRGQRFSLGFDHPPIAAGHAHVCLIYEDEAERCAVLAELLGTGLRAGERVLSLVDTTTPEEFAEVMFEYGLDLRGWSEDDVRVSAAHPVYCPDDRLGVDRVLQTLSSLATETVDMDYVRLRGTGEMTWALGEGRTSTRDLARYETRLDEMIADSPLAAVCQYDARRFDGATLVEVMKAHPFVFRRGQLGANPLYERPSDRDI